MITAPALATAPEALASLGAAYARVRRQVFAVPPILTVSEWCDRHRVLSREASAEPGPWRTARAPYLREILDTIGDPTVPEVVMMTSSQVGKSEVLLNAAAFFAAADPSPVLMVQPTVDDAEKFSRTRIAPMIRDSPTLTGLFADPKSRDGANTLREKVFPGGALSLVGANAPSGLASKPIRVVLFDEVDRAPVSAGTEGDPVTLARRRTETFWNRKVLTTSTPTIAGVSRIEAAFSASSQAYYVVPCPECGHRQRLTWRREGGYAITFERDDAGEVIEASVGYVCEDCASVLPERKKLAMLAAGEWVHTHPGRRIKGYHLSALYSPWATWAHVCREFLASKHSKETLKGFVNTMLGEPYADDGARLDPHVLAARAEPLRPLPLAVATLTAGVDVQADRVEAMVVGWGARERAFVLERYQAWGDPQRDDVWDDLAAWLAAPRDGLAIADVAVDTGYQTDRVWRWIDRRPHGLRLFGVKGMPGRERLILGRPAAVTKKGARSPWLVGVDAAKDALFARLQVVPADDDPDPATRVRFADTLDAAVYEQITSEELKTSYVNGRPVLKWALKPGARNEALDLLVYALAALYRRGAHAVARIAPRATAPPVDGDASPPAAAPSPSSPPTSPVFGRSPRFITGGRW